MRAPPGPTSVLLHLARLCNDGFVRSWNKQHELSRALVRQLAPQHAGIGRLPLSIAATGMMLVAIQVGQPILGLGFLVAALFTSTNSARRSQTRDASPAFVLRQRGDLALSRGRYDEARRNYERALELLQRCRPDDDWDVLVTYFNLAMTHSCLYEASQADKYMGRFIAAAHLGFPRPWRPRVAALLRRIAHQRSRQGAHLRAVKLCETALALVGPAPGADDACVRSLLEDLAWLHYHAGDYPGAGQLFLEALEHYEEAQAVVHRLAGQPIRHDATGSPYRCPSPVVRSTSGGLDRAVASTLLGHAWCLCEQADYDGARLRFDQAAIALARSQTACAPAEDASRSIALQIELWRGRMATAIHRGQLGEAGKFCERVRELIALGDDSLYDIAHRIDQGWLARITNRLDVADSMYQQARELLRRDAHQADALSCALHEGLADLRRRQARYRDALREIARAENLATRHFGSEHPRTAAILAARARIHVARVEFGESERAARRSLEIQRLTTGSDHVHCAKGWLALGELQLARGQLGAALKSLTRALTLRERSLGTRHHDLVDVLRVLAAVHLAAGQDDEAQACAKRADTLQPDPHILATQTEPVGDGRTRSPSMSEVTRDVDIYDRMTG